MNIVKLELEVEVNEAVEIEQLSLVELEMVGGGHATVNTI